MRRPAVIRAAGAHQWHPTTQTIAGRSLDNLVGSHEYGLWDRQAQRLRGLEVDDQLELGGLFDREVSGFGALQNLVYVGGGAMEAVGDVRGVGHEAAGLRELSGSEDGRQLVFFAKSPTSPRYPDVNPSKSIVSASGRSFSSTANARARSSAFRTSMSLRARPSLSAAARVTRNSRWAAGLQITTRRATRGATSFSSSSRFEPSSGVMRDSPVTLPPGRARLATKRSATGSEPPVMTIGIVLVACFAALISGSGPAATMISTFVRTSSSAR